MSGTDAKPITALLNRWNAGDKDALAELTPVVYDELRALAQSAFRSERAGHTLQATAIVHEAYLQLVNASVDWEGRHHFFALAARMMRRLLVNHANARSAQKRGGSPIMLTFDEGAVADKQRSEDVLDLDRGLLELAEADDWGPMIGVSDDWGQSKNSLFTDRF
jgi:RNA polymerase sigma factor (TIGR02999 family)